jgi:molybdopterin molybdotransferase
MTTYNEALKIILDSVHSLEMEEKPLTRSSGQVLAEDISSDYDFPQADCSGPDGYAVRSADIRETCKENPVTLRIIGTIRAGHLPSKKVESGTAMRIMTGAVLPQGADCVVRFEDTDEPGNKNGPNRNNPSKVKIYVSAVPGANIFKKGAQTARGTTVLNKGKSIGPAQISILTLVGKSTVKVIRRPVVAVLSSGDELIRSGAALSPGKTFDCNGPAAIALIKHYGGIAKNLGIARDNEKSILNKLQKALTADAIVMSGGVSKGDYDLTRLSLDKIGEVKFSRINMGPGASFAFGIIKKKEDGAQPVSVPVFALSGPPAGCLINFETLVRPALLKMMGYTELEHPFVEARTEDAAAPRGKMAFVRWSNVEKTGGEYSVKFNTRGMATANSLTIVREETSVQTGDKIEVLPLDWCRD